MKNNRFGNKKDIKHHFEKSKINTFLFENTTAHSEFDFMNFEMTKKNVEALVLHLPIATVLLDCYKRVAFWNSFAEKLFGWNIEEIKGHLHPVVPRDKYDEFHLFFQATTRGECIINKEVVRKRKDGSDIKLALDQSSIVAVTDSSGKIKGLLIQVFTQRSFLKTFGKR